MGTSSLIRADKQSLNLTSLAGIVEVVRDLKAAGFHVILVSSGAVGVGCQRLGLKTRPDNLAQKQALAAVGQPHLMRYYDELFGAVGLVGAAAAASGLRRVGETARFPGCCLRAARRGPDRWGTGTQVHDLVMRPTSW